VGHNETIKAVADFNSELTGAFLRLTSERQNLNVAWERYAALEEKINLTSKEQDRLMSLMDEYNAQGEKDEQQWKVLQRKYDVETKKLERLNAELDEQLSQVMPAHMNLIQRSLQEAAELDRLLVTVIQLFRSELDLPFDVASYNQVVEENHKKQAQFLQAFIHEQAIELDSQEQSS
jgi:hypothetical protein